MSWIKTIRNSLNKAAGKAAQRRAGSAAAHSHKRSYGLFQIEPTLQCSLSCVMCPWAELRPENAMMTWETFSNIARYLSLAEAVDLTGGGEPLLSPLLPEMVRMAKEAGCTVGFSTNGMRLVPAMSEQLVSLGLDWISFSVDAATPEMYESIRQGASFEVVTSNIRALHEIKQATGSQVPKMMMVFVMMGDLSGGQDGRNGNYQQLPQFIETAHALGVEQVIAKNLDVILKDGDDDRRLFSHDGPPQNEVHTILSQAQARARELGVGLRTYLLQPQEQTICEHDPLRNLFFNWRGEVSPCITLSYAEKRVFDGERILVPCQRFGNINQGSLESIWGEPAYQEFRRAFEQRQAWQQSALIDMVLGSSDEAAGDIPPAPEGCRTCYYLYGI
ncbi:MAG: radical SAM protein [Chloroflexota bacterium]